MKISDVIAAKSRHDVVTLAPDAGVRELVRVLSEYNIGAVIVSPDGREVVGIVSERDIVRRLITDERVLEARVSDLMTTAVAQVTPESSIDETRRLMTDRRVRHLPVVDDGGLRGIVSIGDVVKAHIDQVEFERDQLDSYVHRR